MKKLSMAEKAKKAGLPAQTVYNRMHNGWTEKRALSVPNGNYKKKTVAYKVEPKKEQAPRSKGTHNTAVGQKPTIPLPVEKFEKQRDNKQMYVAIALGIALVLAVAIATR